MSLITLLTDFGTRDEYVGVLKGVIYTINPNATVVDLSHEVAPQDVRAAAYLLRASYEYFPKGSIHMAVVDPGVGSRRKVLAARAAGHVFLAPDNGLLDPLLARGGVETMVAVDAPELYRPPVSRTFHGRDIFAPVAAHLSLGYAIGRLGAPMDPDEAVRLAGRETPHFNGHDEVCGHVVRIDRFGNLITNIGSELLAAAGLSDDAASLEIRIGDTGIQGISASYSDAPDGAFVAVVGSSNCLEIAVAMGNAAKMLNLQIDAEVYVRRK
ncbi:MAG: SAM-dependent chlorinase/fluorinase [Desulfosarcinaceae bacterium]